MNKKVLIAYYSRTGVTEKIALQLKKKIESECDIEKIIDTQNRNGIFGFIKSAYQGLNGKMTKIEDTKNDVSKYDLVIIGTPVWAGNITCAVRTYINLNKNKFKKIAFFTTQAAEKDYNVFNNMEELCEKSPIATLKIVGSDIKTGDYEKKSKTFIDSLL